MRVYWDFVRAGVEEAWTVELTNFLLRQQVHAVTLQFAGRGALVAVGAIQAY